LNSIDFDEFTFVKSVRRFNGFSPRKVGITTTIVYAALLIVMYIFHEPWLDEAQSWLIARDASFHDMLFVLPKYEGHVPLWWFILSVPAKLGVPYEPGLKSINFIFAIATIGLIELKTKLPNAAKIFLPFGYFMFYQYGVISRPYMLLALTMVLSGIFFKERDTNPWKYTLTLILLCLTDTYGIAIAGGLAMAWIWDIARREPKAFFENITRKNPQRFLGFLTLLAAAIFCLILAWPDDSAIGLYNAESTAVHGPVASFFLELFLVPSEVFFTSFANFGLMGSIDLEAWQYIVVILLGIFVWAAVICYTVKRKISAEVILPSTLVFLVGTQYMIAYHYGFIFLIILRAFIAGQEIETENKKIDLFTFVSCTALAVSFLISLYWTFASCFTDILYPYWIGRDAYEWIEENNLEEGYTWFETWDTETYLAGEYTTPINPYLSEPLIYNGTGTSYLVLKSETEEEFNEKLEQWKTEGAPDFIVGRDTDVIFSQIEELGLTENYDMVYIRECRRSYKDDFTKGGIIIFKRADLDVDIEYDLEDMASIQGENR